MGNELTLVLHCYRFPYASSLLLHSTHYQTKESAMGVGLTVFVAEMIDDEKRLNATYIISVARKLGCSIFLLPDDIMEVILLQGASNFLGSRSLHNF